ncbi:Os07g0444000 [Oryza sativa Japonica Group]|jgi:non-lysosomal glucosylceramidase|uniref:Os07g0444000 protein n=1 Tax=Oryza sativa subsp. japonica TaxID=39947 RepID=A0A0P0X5C2_ORYSJ|nr:hypothetical protein EE612_038907 [Oryza sativa]BAT01283.1 Os07g0444000 [Oryza sativa Japonica Group]
MVSSNMFYRRKRSWRAGDLVSRSTLQLLDFDDGSPPEYAWRRKLSSHANRLKEFNVTFREAIKMVQEMQLSAFPVHGNSGCDCSSFC